jgi:hypothetical protein
LPHTQAESGFACGGKIQQLKDKSTKGRNQSTNNSLATGNAGEFITNSKAKENHPWLSIENHLDGRGTS